MLDADWILLSALFMSKLLRSFVSLSIVQSRFVSPSVGYGSFALVSTMSTCASDPVHLSDDEWKQRLTPTQFQVLRLKGTERAGTGEYTKHKETGVYLCAGCKTPVYMSTTKFDSGCGWPAFYDAIPGAIKVRPSQRLWSYRIVNERYAAGGC